MLRVQLLNKQRAEDDYASSRVSIDKRQVPWLLSPAERKALPIGALRKLRQLEREEEGLGVVAECGVVGALPCSSGIGASAAVAVRYSCGPTAGP